MKILYCANVLTHIKFHIPFLEWLKEQGYEIHVAANKNCDELSCVDKFYNIPFQRSPFNFKNYFAYKELKKILIENNYKLIHFHTPVASFVGRLVTKFSGNKSNAKVFYTAHGFHFYKGAPLFNWLIILPIEKLLSRITDYIITIAEEDYMNAIKYKFKSKVYKVNGVGVDLSRFYPRETNEIIKIREKNGFRKDDFILIYPAGFDKNKNHIVLIKAMQRLKTIIPNIKMIFCGVDWLNGEIQNKITEFGLENNIFYLGRRYDIDELITMADISISASLREGLPRNIMEGMASGNPIVASENRGHRELIKVDRNGYLFNPRSEESFIEAVTKLYNSSEKTSEIISNNIADVKRYSLNSVMDQMIKIYNKELISKSN